MQQELDEQSFGLPKVNNHPPISPLKKHDDKNKDNDKREDKPQNSDSMKKLPQESPKNSLASSGVKFEEMKYYEKERSDSKITVYKRDNETILKFTDSSLEEVE